MSLLDRFKKNKKEEKIEAVKKGPRVEVEKKIEKIEPKSEKPVAKKTQADNVKKIEKKEFSQAWRILAKPLVTEKATTIGELHNQYIFEVADRANKIEIKKAIQDFYGVNVEKVNVMNVRGKKKRVGRHEGWRPGFKKAIVFLAPEEKIEIIAR